MNLNLPVNQAMDLIESAHFDWIDHIYGGSIPREVQDNVDSNDILITETENEPGKYSNNQFKKWKIGVEISIFYKKEIPADFNMMKAEIDLVKLLKVESTKMSHSSWYH
ncbi:hypothetical protein IWT25_02293 [Secundilactobacillus pentosiphilus]|uniref:Uncharacterized protein n=1 Tax=Secundilactobacillus pentosiphilus TaxID=1714682 RepID=A0A1Z5IYS9_9LACO|nr:DUF806 family protein [Secundilactobacillus pentosiphilus]GAX06945.1 hypothetical protein IWT25_02293 [Secundilactobacillus pentosiphilus]